jgi:hypothetical protein
MKIISSFDFLGISPSITIEGNKKHKTVFGGLMSIFVAALLLGGSTYFMILLISRTNYSLLVSEEFYPNSFSNWTNSEVSFYLTNRVGQFLEDADRIYTVVGTYWQLKKIQNTDGTSVMRSVPAFLKMEKCNVTRHFKSNPDLWENEKYITHSYCMAPNQLVNVSKPFGYDESTYISFWVQKCQNTTTKNDCFPREYIDKTLVNVFLLSRFTNYYFDHSLQGDTSVPYIHNDGFFVSSTVYKRFSYSMRSVQYDTDAGIFLTNIETKNYTNLVDYKESVDLRTESFIPDVFITVAFNMNILKQKITKRYYKFQNMLADMGGLLKGLVSISSFFNWYFCNKQFYNQIINANINSFPKNEYLNEFALNKEQDVRKINYNIENPRKNCDSKTPIKSNIKSDDFVARIKFNSDPKQLNCVESPKNKVYVNNCNNNSLKARHIFKSKQENLNIKNLYEKNAEKEKFKMNCIEHIFPMAFFPKHSSGYRNLLINFKLREIVSRELDVLNIIPKLYSVDKLSYLLAGKEYMSSIYNISNPVLYTEGIFSEKTDFCELREIIINLNSKSSS